MEEPLTEPAELDGWTSRVTGALELPDASADIGAVLDLARDTAHGVMRPAAPLTAYLVGVAVGRGMPLPDAVAAVGRCIEEHE
ncbi:molybdopterin-guanine dinucleotide biosynthesis protein [Curtobacterium pusillum]|uniref:Molybdopterin-guanine dinucleotide biosynthesis protein n=1 Tax=Curtobacterium pusillum TaxID=69373 RepID=A0ABX2MAP2_9MICO|nr:molybdopterin-guanine dinucleotide biosynthesis protein [Curtobacterium pusillum]